MGLVDVIEERDITQLQQVLLGALDRVKELITELRDETDIIVEIHFNKKKKDLI